VLRSSIASRVPVVPGVEKHVHDLDGMAGIRALQPPEGEKGDNTEREEAGDDIRRREAEMVPRGNGPPRCQDQGERGNHVGQYLSCVLDPLRVLHSQHLHDSHVAEADRRFHALPAGHFDLHADHGILAFQPDDHSCVGNRGLHGPAYAGPAVPAMIHVI